MVLQKGQTLPGCPPHLPLPHRYLHHLGHQSHHHLSPVCQHFLLFLDHLWGEKKQLNEQKEQEELYNVAQLILTHSYKRARFYLKNSPRNFNFSQSFTKSFHRWQSVTFSL